MNISETPPRTNAMSDPLPPLRLHQQELLSRLGVLALRGTPFPELLDHAVQFTADGMQAEFTKVLKYNSATGRFLVKAGVGWGPGVVGRATVGADLASPAGFALRTGQPVISNHLGNEDRFRTPDLLLEHGVRRAMNVILQGDGVPYGVLEVDSRSEGEFSEYDIAFLQGAADMLGTAIERQRVERDLREALDHHKLLIKEISHRLNNSLQLVSGMLHLQAGAADDHKVRAQLNEASNRITAIARVHRRLYQSDQIAILDLEQYVTDICIDIQASIPSCEISIAASASISLSLDQAVPLALLLGELITNAAKHAHKETPCNIIVKLAKNSEDRVTVSVRDHGSGLAPDFDISAQKGLGMRIVRSFATQLQATLDVERHDPGTEFIISFVPVYVRL